MHSQIVQFLRLLPEPGLLITGTGDVLAANPAAGRMLGCDDATLPGRRLTDLVSDPPDKVERFVRMCARSRQLIPGALTWRTAGADAADIRCDGAVLQPSGADAPAVVFVRCRPKTESTDQFVLLNRKIAELSQEIVQRRKAEQQRDELLASERAARVEAERVSRLKDEFLATLSHELRTPLNSILGWTQVLLQSVPPAESETVQGLEVIERNARLQTRLIEDLLDMSRIISGKIRLDVQRVDLGGVINAAVAAVQPAAEAKGIRLQVTLDPIAGPVRGDPARLQQVVWNLLSNAVKFTDKRGRVQVALERVNSHLEVIVSDTGEGIVPELLPHVFDRFRQGDGSSTRRQGGLGLGLSIVKQLVELHGGEVRAKSPGEGKGATFVVSLPLMVLHDDAAGRPAASQPERVHPASADANPCAGVSLTDVRVLVVDDEPDAREMVRRILEACGGVVRVAGSATEAMAALHAGPVDVLISDIGMPGDDGYELIRQVRRLPRESGGQTPALALTAFARSEDRRRAIVAGYQMHLSKPVETAELVVVVASLAGRSDIRSR